MAIDHVSLGVRDLATAAGFYDAALRPLGYARLVERAGSIGYGRRFPELWIHARPGMAAVATDTGCHLALRAASPEVVSAFHAGALKGGGSDDGAPGERAYSRVRVFAAFVRDPDGNRLEAMTILGELPAAQS
ncbi:VOC family protein [Marinibaculum pumilum]|uniref:VOC family protein n=1 Tax=Marinibaculum pumilum TaxID=1766165 RepID=A0ABV7L6W6_9PROT